MKNLPPNKLPLETEVTRAVDKYLAVPDIHDVQREKAGGFASMVLGIVVCVLETLLIFGVIHSVISPIIALLLHMAIVIVLLAITRALASTSEGRFMLLLLLVVVTTGPFGAGGMALAVLLYLWSTRHALGFDEWFDSIFPKQPQTSAQLINENILTGRDESSSQYSVISFMDVLSFGNEVQKRMAISKATANFHPNFAPVFRKALSDSSNTIRVLAATAIGKIESLFLSRMIQLTEIKESHDKDPLVIWALAEHYDNYAFTGLLDFDREQINRQNALTLYREYLRLRPQDVEPRNRIGRILMRNKEFEKACDWFRSCIADGYVSDTISEWYSEALFNCGRYEDLRRYRSSLPKHSAAVNRALNDALVLWSGNKI